jgi:hypothetical protein
MDALGSPRDRAPSRYFIWLVVVLAHASLIAAILLSHPRFFRELRRPSYSLSLLRLPNDPAKNVPAKIIVRLDAAALHFYIDRDLPRPPIPINNNAITLAPSEQLRQHIDNRPIAEVELTQMPAPKPPFQIYLISSGRPATAPPRSLINARVPLTT